jgi:hypothetical protein
LCRAIRQDLDKPELRFQPGQLIHLHAATRDLAQKLTSMLGEPK